eukprot:8456197-Karenia_brevis.AAC.1
MAQVTPWNSGVPSRIQMLANIQSFDLISWNTRALFANNAKRRRSRMQHVNKSAKNPGVKCLQE